MSALGKYNGQAVRNNDCIDCVHRFRDVPGAMQGSGLAPDIGGHSAEVHTA
jgi:hypothetical protein